MKKFLILLASIIPISALTSFSIPSSSVQSYNIVEVYKEAEVNDKAKTIDSYDRVTDVKKLLLPTTMKIGKHKVKITRIDSDLYQICDTQLYIETQYCYKFATKEEVVINITSNYGYIKGELVFF